MQTWVSTSLFILLGGNYYKMVGCACFWSFPCAFIWCLYNSCFCFNIKKLHVFLRLAFFHFSMFWDFSVGVSTQKSTLFFFFLKIAFKKVIYSSIFGCAGSSLLCAGFLCLQRLGITLRCSAWASHWGVFSYRRAQALEWGSVVGAHRLNWPPAFGIFPDQE